MANPATQSATADKADSRAEAEADAKPEMAAFWLGELEAAGKRDKDWIDRARKVVARYRDERREAGSEKRANILWSNTEILKAALFGVLGSPDVRRRFPKRGKDERNTKQAALVMERGASFSNDAYDCEAQIEACVEDMVLPGRGQAWVVYDANIIKNEESGEDEIAYQSVREEHLFWEDYRTSAGRKESDLWWKARRHYYTRDKLREFFKKHADKVPLNAQLADATKDKKDDDTFKRATVWEIWDKTKRQRIYVAEDYPLILKKDDDPYRLEHFFPCPAALYNGFQSTSTLEPQPEFCLYQDQADELDRIATRLSVLVEALKRRGVYDASEDEGGKLSNLAHAGDNEFVPYRGFAGLAEKGGLRNIFQTEDLAPLIAAIEGLYKRGEVLVNTIYEVTGISDVIRGAQAAGETATEVRIKGQYGSMRLRKRQRQVQRFIRDITRIKTEIIAEHFTREQLEEMCGITMPLAADKQMAMQQLQAAQQQMQMMQQMQQGGPQGPPGGQMGQGGGPSMGHNGGPPMGPGMAPGMMPMQPIDPEMLQELEEITKLPTWEDISAILRSDQRRGYKIDIETEDTVAQDDAEEKQSRMEFLTAVTGLMEKAIPMAMQMPPMKPLVKESVMFLVKGFKAGRPLEEAFEEAFAQLEKQPPPEQPNPEMAALQLEEKKAQQTLQLEQAKAQQTNQLKQQEFAHSKQLKEAEMAHTFQMEQYKLHNEIEMEQRKLVAQEQIEGRKLESQQQLQAAELQHKQAMGEQELGLKSQQFERTAQMDERKFSHETQMADRTHSFERERFDKQHSFEREKMARERDDDDLEGILVPEGGNRRPARNGQSDAVMKEMKDVIAAQSGVMKEISEAVAAVKASSTPRRVIRDRDGRVAGIE